MRETVSCDMTWRKFLGVFSLAAVLGVGVFLFLSIRALPLPMLVATAIDEWAPYRTVAEWYLVNQIPPDPVLGYRSPTGQSILQFTLAAYEGGIRSDGTDRLTSADTHRNQRVLRIAKHFITLGMDPNTRGPFGLTALHDAILFNSPEVVSFLVQVGADLNAPAGAGKFNGVPPLDFAIVMNREKPHPNRERIVQLLKDAGAGKPTSTLQGH